MEISQSGSKSSMSSKISVSQLTGVPEKQIPFCIHHLLSFWLKCTRVIQNCNNVSLLRKLSPFGNTIASHHSVNIVV